MKRIICVLMAIMMMAAILVACGGDDDRIVVGSKQFTENILLAEMYTQLIENLTDIPVERRQNLGGTFVIFPALESGEVDIFPEYSGTVWNSILGIGELGADSDEIYRRAVEGLYNDFNVTMFNPIGINNTFAIAVLQETADELGLVTMSDLAAASSNLRFGANHLFFDRQLDGYPRMVEIYGMNFSDSLRMDRALLYDAIVQGQLDAIEVFATESQLKRHGLVVLEDDLGMFPAYHASAIARNDALERFPELRDVLDLLEGRITNVRMQELNYEVDFGNRTVADVARDFLQSEGLI